MEEPHVIPVEAVEAAAKKSGFVGRVKESKVPYCLRPGAEVGNVCPYPWWTMLIRLGTLWRCPYCSKVSILEWIEAGGWGMKSWATHEHGDEPESGVLVNDSGMPTYGET